MMHRIEVDIDLESNFDIIDVTTIDKVTLIVRLVGIAAHGHLIIIPVY
jgi:hypothetical protein